MLPSVVGITHVFFVTTDVVGEIEGSVGFVGFGVGFGDEFGH